MAYPKTRALLSLLLLLFAAAAAAAQTSDLTARAVEEPATTAETGASFDFSAHSFRLYLASHPELLRPVRILDLRYDRAVRLALWNDPLGRVYYNLAAEESMLGRTGLVNGGRALGAGLALTALGGASSPLAAYVETLMPPAGSSRVSIGVRSTGPAPAAPLPGFSAGPEPQ